MPDIVFLQEFRVGENEVFLNRLKKKLGKFYNFIFPSDYSNADMNHCICITLAGKNILRGQPGRLQNDGAFKLRYNFLALDDYIFLNAWMPQIFTVTPERRKVAEDMWESLLSTVDQYADKPKKFCLIGDLNAYKEGPFGENIKELNGRLFDSKVIEDKNRPTGEVNVLDYAFVNPKFPNHITRKD